jgi:hypothetical protein
VREPHPYGSGSLTLCSATPRAYDYGRFNL